jgi:molybdopterin synthase sulfur carrier subunit
MHLLYFGWVRSRIGVGGEDITPPAEIGDVRGLIAWLSARGKGYAEAFADLRAVRIAVNQEMTDLDAAVKQGDEVALFPPMTGG